MSNSPATISPPAPTDALRAARNRELLAFRDRALHLAYRMSGNADDAEDILQEAYLRAVMARAVAPSGAPLRNWFLQIVANVARDFHRNEGGRRARERRVAMENSSAHTASPALSAEESELKENVESELAKLDEKMRVPISLHYEHGLSFEEASSVLGIPAGTLRVQACRGLDELRARLGAKGRPATAEIIVAALAAGFTFHATPAVAASVEAIVATGAKAGAAGPAAGAKVFLSSTAPKISFATAACIAAGVAAVLMLGVFLGARSVLSSFYSRQSPTPEIMQAQVVPEAAPDIVAPRTVQVETFPPKTGFLPVAQKAVSARKSANYIAPPDVEQQWQTSSDLLANVDAVRDAVVGDWEFKQNELVVLPYKYSRLALNYYPGEEYDYRVDFTRTSGNAEIDVVFPVRGRSALLSVGAWGKLYFGGDPNSADAVSNFGLQSKLRYTVIVEVRKQSLTAYVDGKLVKTISTENQRYLCNQHWRMPDQETLGIGSWESGVTFHRAAVRDVSGTGHAKEPDEDEIRLANPQHWKDAVDLLTPADPQKLTVTGKWSKENGAIKSGKSDFARMELGYEPPAEYDFRVDVRRIDGKRDIVQINSVKGRQFSWKYSSDDHCMFDTIDGKLWAASPAAMVMPEMGKDKEKHVSVVCVRKDCIKAFVDGKLIVKWKTDFSDMGIDIWKLKHENVLGIGALDSQVIFENIQVKEISGKGRMISGVKPGEEAF